MVDTDLILDEMPEINYDTKYPSIKMSRPTLEGGFIDELQRKLDEIDDTHEITQRIITSGVYQGNSPVSMSSNGSGNTSDLEIGHVKKKHSGTQDSYENSLPKYRKLSFEEVEQSLQKHYNKNSSNELDILITFLKGQTHIYSRANQVTLRNYYWFIIPSILLSGGLAVIAPFISGNEWEGWFICIVNAIVTMLIAICDRLKLQSSSEIYLNMSTQFNKLETSLEFSRNQISFTEDRKIVLEKMKSTEEKWMIFRDSYPISIPIEIQMQNPIISHVNIFSFIKKIELYKKDLILKYKDIKNEIQYIMHKWNEEEMNVFESGTVILKKNHEKERLSFLLNEKQQVKTDLIHYGNAYVYIDDLFSREIKHSEFYETWLGIIFFFLGFVKESVKKKTYENSNPVVDNYLNFIFT